MADGGYLSSRSDYTFVDPGDIPITGDIYPVRRLRNPVSARCLRREDFAALAEAAMRVEAVSHITGPQLAQQLQIRPRSLLRGTPVDNPRSFQSVLRSIYSMFLPSANSKLVHLATRLKAPLMDGWSAAEYFNSAEIGLGTRFASRVSSFIVNDGQPYPSRVLAEMAAAWIDVARPFCVKGVCSWSAKSAVWRQTTWSQDGESADHESIDDSRIEWLEDWGWREDGTKYRRDYRRCEGAAVSIYVDNPLAVPFVAKVRANPIFQIETSTNRYIVGLDDTVDCTLDRAFEPGEVNGRMRYQKWDLPPEYLNEGYLKRILTVYGLLTGTTQAYRFIRMYYPADFCDVDLQVFPDGWANNEP